MRNRDEIVKYGGWFGVVFLSDRLSKVWVMSGQQLVVINRGGMLGVVPGWWWGVASVAICLWMIQVVPEVSKKQRWGLVTVVAAGLANGVDRLIYGGVVDFITYPIWGVVGNLADIWLGLGVIIVALTGIKQNLSS